jgi:hypothetical protein
VPVPLPLPALVTSRHMPQAPATRPPITMMDTWLAAPMIRSTIPRPSATAPRTGPAADFAARAGGAGAPGAGTPGQGRTGPWGADPYGR